ncbi:MAG TPA: M14 family zinc carboxypeptidase [Mobilitalea sp.]|nr:M14 family zinc carboxypeptidase [Mobilitalea sp.]
MKVNLNEAYYSYDKFISDAKFLAKKYETVLQYVTIGKSHDNRDIILLKLGIGQQSMICCSGVHARETINPVVMLRIVECYADLYVNHKKQKYDLKSKLNNENLHLKDEYEKMLYGACIYELLQTFTILFVPLLNPDGYMVALKGFDTIRDENLRQNCIEMQTPYTDWKYNARGVDINRNFPSKLWRPKDEFDQAASENETMALINLFHEYKTKGFLDFHSRGKQIYYYRSMLPESYNKQQLEIANRLMKITNYELVPPKDEIETGDTGGNTVHYYSEHFLKPALTIETVEDEAVFPLDYRYRFSTFEELKLVIIDFGSMII